MPQRWVPLIVAGVLVAFSVPIAAQQESIEELRTRAEAENTMAQYNLGIKYDAGEGVPQDAVEAVRWYRLAADQGYARAI